MFNTHFLLTTTHPAFNKIVFGFSKLLLLNTQVLLLFAFQRTIFNCTYLDIQNSTHNSMDQYQEFTTTAFAIPDNARATLNSLLLIKPTF